ncbi:MAG: hypothetical protein IJ565_04935 [Bacilli bacterium]|nr:hypothetical protein [Bacilli bacterium]
MKIAIQVGEQFILLDDEVKDNIGNDEIKEEIINSAMEVLDNEKRKMAYRRKTSGVKVKTLGVHPLMRPNNM